MTFQQLNNLVEIAKCGSINKAAHKLFLSQSGISASVKELEQELGICFFTRSNRGVELTAEGREFLGHAMSLLEHKRYIQSLYGEDIKLPAPSRFSLSTQRFPFSAEAFFALLDERQDRRYTFSIKETELDAVIDDVFDHRAELGVISVANLGEQMILSLLRKRELEFHELVSVTPSIYLRAGHPLSGREKLSEDELEGYPYVSFEMRQGAAADFLEEYPMMNKKKAGQCIMVNDRKNAIDAIARTDAYTTGSGLLTSGERARGVVTVPLDVNGYIRIGWLCVKNARLSSVAEQYLERLEQSISECVANH